MRRTVNAEGARLDTRPSASHVGEPVRRPTAAAAIAELAALSMLTALSACSTFVPARLESIAPESKVAVVLTATGTDSLERALGPGVSRVTGAFLRVDGDGVVMRVDATEGIRAPERRWSGETVSLPRRFVSGVERPQFSRLRTGLLTAGAIAAVALLNAGFGGGGSGGGVSGSGSTGGK